MNYNMLFENRTQLIKDLKYNKDQLFLCPHRKSFQVSNKKISVLFDDSMKDVQLLELILYHQVRHIIQNSFQKAQEKLNLLCRLFEKESQYFDENFNLLCRTLKTKTIDFNHETERNKIIDELCYFAGLSTVGSRSTKILQTVEELLMNAQISAPSTAQQASKLTSHLKIEISENLIAFSAIDPYGTLDIKKFFKKIEAGHALGLDQAISFKKGGAGVGSSLIFQNCDSLFLGVQPSKKTRVSVIMPYNTTDRKYEGIQKSIHLF